MSFADFTEEERADFFQLCRDRPEVWFRTWLGWEPWSKQIEIAHSVRDHRHTAVPTCNAAGKSAIVARLAMWWPSVFFPAVSISTAPTERQVKEILWKEIHTAYETSIMPLSKPGTEPTGTKWQLTRDQRALGITAPEYDPNKFQGIRDRYTLIIVDEACGITPQIYDAIGGIMASGAPGETKLVEIGNPTDANTPFADHCEDPKVNVINIGAYDTPNFTMLGITEEKIVSGEWEQCVAYWNEKKDRKRFPFPLPTPWLASPAWAREMFERHGLTGLEYQSRVRGEFPQQSEEAVFARYHVQKARRYVASENEYEANPIIMSVDVARKGQDETVLVIRQGNKYAIMGRYAKMDNMQVAGRVLHHYKELVRDHYPPEVIRIDSIGQPGVYDRLLELGLPVEEFIASAAAFEDQRFLNCRAEAYWGLKDLMEDEHVDLPDNEDMQKQMIGIKWETPAGRIQIESKDKMRRRGVKSPDIVDAIVIASYDGGRQPGDVGVTT